jgi:hypothetical protein
MGVKLTAKQQTQLAWLEGLRPKFDKLAGAVEQFASMQADETLMRSTIRLLGELKSQASILGIGSLAENFGYMETMLRRGGGHQMRVRGLRELLVGAKTNFEGAIKAASKPDESSDDDNDETTSP